MSDRKYCVYKHTTPNNKVYIGLTGQEPEARWKNGHGYRGNNYFFRAINKYGWENIESEILLNGLTSKEASLKEQHYISEYKSNISEYGFNMTSGGEIQYKLNDDAIIKNLNGRIKAGVVKLGWEEAKKIREDYKCNEDVYSLSKKYGVTPETISNVIRNRSWIDFNYEGVETARVNHLTEKEASKMRTLFLKENYTYKMLMSEFGVSKNVVNSVVNNRSYKDDEYNNTYEEDTYNEVTKIRMFYISNPNYTHEDMAELFNKKIDVMTKILGNITWFDEDYISPPQLNRHKLFIKAQQVRSIYAKGEHSYNELAKHLGVNYGFINNVLNNDSYPERKKDEYEISNVNEKRNNFIKKTGMKGA